MPATVDYITRFLGCRKEELCFIGDRLATDVAIGMNHNIPSVLVYSGVTTPEMYDKSPFRATLAVKNLKTLIEYL
jgi:4-nitrophenyl phosphatase